MRKTFYSAMAFAAAVSAFTLVSFASCKNAAGGGDNPSVPDNPDNPLPVEKVLNVLVVDEADGSTESEPLFIATALYSDGEEKDVTSEATWLSSDENVATVNSGKVTLVSEGETVVTATYSDGKSETTSAKQTLSVSKGSGKIDRLYFIPGKFDSEASPRYAAYFFVDDSTNEWVSMTKDSATGYWFCSKPGATDYPNVIFVRMNPSSTQNSWDSNVKWNQTADLTISSDKDTYEYTDTAIKDKGTGKWLDALSGSYSSDKLTAKITSENIPLPPKITISPSGNTVSLSGAITVSYEENGSPVTAAAVSAGSKTYSLSDFSGGVLRIKVSDLGINSENQTINVVAKITNGIGTSSKTAGLTTKSAPQVPDTFTWDNANVYFVIQDRFYDGDSSNNNSYGRVSVDEKGKIIGTFHGGDIKGLTEKLDYLNGLGVNAIWLTALYEQAHGWCGGGSSGDFAHYAYHGYYPLDYTMMDKNMGTVEDFRTFVTEAHSRGIRVVMDVVMNHTGYFTLQDMQDYSVYPFKTQFKGYSVSASRDLGYTLSGTGDADYHKYHNYLAYDASNQGASEWLKWWGSSWVRAGVPGYTSGGNDDLTKNLDSLPDVKTESSAAQTVPPLLKTKWSKETSGYDNWIVPAAKPLRSTSASNAPAVWIEKWLAAWVEEFGIDGFRCDTAKHVDKYRWKELKELCGTALKAWRNSSRADEYAKDWDEDFWMTGESFGWRSGGDSSWFSNGFDSMIDFSVAGSSDMQTYSPNLPDWNSRLGNKQALLYISSHDTGLGRSSNQTELGTSFVLMPGLIQIYYGDETSRPFGDTGSDKNQGTRSDFNWDSAASETSVHWGKLGTFRKFNPAVGAGTGSAYKRTYSGSAGESKVAIGISGTSVDVSGLFENGTTVYNWYDGKSAAVNGGNATFAGSGGTKSQPILVSDRNPADYGVSF